MPQQFVPTEENTVTQAASPAPTQTERRYDTQTVQEIIALAEQMQTRHRETLSADEVEALGREVGVDPEFLRRALVQIESQNSSLPTVIAPRRTKNDGQSRFLTRSQRAMVILPAALFMLFAPLTFGIDDHLGTNTSVFLYVVLPFILPLLLGIKGKSKRVGVFGGGLLGFVTILSLLANMAFHHHAMPSLGEFVTVLAIWTCIGATLGFAGAVLRPQAAGPRKKVRLVVETSDPKEKATPGEWA